MIFSNPPPIAGYTLPKFKLIWGNYFGRTGWWVERVISTAYGDIRHFSNMRAIFGPSICISSGGGSKVALKMAEMEGYKDIEVVTTIHNDVLGKPCPGC